MKFFNQQMKLGSLRSRRVFLSGWHLFVVALSCCVAMSFGDGPKTLELEKVRIRKPVAPENWLGLSISDQPKVVGPTVQIRPKPRSVTFQDETPNETVALGSGDDSSRDSIAGAVGKYPVTDGSDEVADSNSNAKPNESLKESDAPYFDPLNTTTPFGRSAGNISGSNVRGGAPASNIGGSSGPATSSGNSGSGSSGGSAMGSSAAASGSASESEYREDDSKYKGDSKDKDDDKDKDDSKDKGDKGINWNKNLDLEGITAVNVAEGDRFEISGSVNLKKSRLEIGGEGDTDITGKLVGKGDLVKSGSGTLTLYGKNNYQGDLTISGGTLLLGASNRLSDKVNVQLAGGAFATGGFDEQVGELTLTRDSIIDLGQGESVLKFSDSSSSGWTAGEVVEVRNWSGSAGGGGVDQLYFGNSPGGLTSDQLGQIQFFDPFGENSGRFPARILPSGEIVPAPEPSTILAALGILGWIGFREKNRLLGWFKRWRS
jgi:autotransporter-associated beta strand protein